MGERMTEALGILNRWGDLWTSNTFQTREEAEAHLKRFWASPGFQKVEYDPKHFPIVPVRVTVTPINPRPTTHKGERG